MVPKKTFDKGKNLSSQHIIHAFNDIPMFSDLYTKMGAGQI